MTTAIPMSAYPRLLTSLRELSTGTKKQKGEAKGHLRNLARTDLYFLLRYIFGRTDIEDPWLFARCREVQENPNGRLDLWAREHYKSTIITYAKTVQDILASHGDDPIENTETTIGIFSFNRPNAKKFLRQLQAEFETNTWLRELFPDIIWEKPDRDAPVWSLDAGLVLKRRSNPKEATVEAWGLVDSMPTGAHFIGRVYDDVITEKFARSPEMIAKTTESWELSINLGARGGWERYIGTRYHANDSYRQILKRGSAVPRVYSATEDGTVEGKPVFLNPDELAKKRRDMGPYTFACQMMQNPVADEQQGFKREWLRYHSGSDGSGMNIYMLVDPASEKKRTNDYTVIEVIGLGSDRNYYTLDLIRDRLNLKERTDAVFSLHRKWRPTNVGYEKYGLQADVEHIKDRMDRDTYHFSIIEVGGQLSKNDRIKRLVPVFEQGRWYMPETIYKTNYEGKTIELIDSFIHEEYMAFPVPVHDDMLDAKARIFDIDTTWPIGAESLDRYASKPRRRGSSWSM